MTTTVETWLLIVAAVAAAVHFAGSSFHFRSFAVTVRPARDTAPSAARARGAVSAAGALSCCRISVRDADNLRDDSRTNLRSAADFPRELADAASMERRARGWCMRPTTRDMTIERRI